jgi:hypothetical protein
VRGDARKGVPYRDTYLRLCLGSSELWGNVPISRLCLPEWPSVRQIGLFSAIPIAQRSLEERCRRAWVVNLETDQAVAFEMLDDGRSIKVGAIHLESLIPKLAIEEVVGMPR